MYVICYDLFYLSVICIHKWLVFIMEVFFLILVVFSLRLREAYFIPVSAPFHAVWAWMCYIGLTLREASQCGVGSAYRGTPVLPSPFFAASQTHLKLQRTVFKTWTFQTLKWSATFFLLDQLPATPRLWVIVFFHRGVFFFLHICMSAQDRTPPHGGSVWEAYLQTTSSWVYHTRT